MKSIITVFCLIALTLSVNAWALNDDKALMLYFTFDEDEGGKVTDVSGNNIEGTLEGSVWSKDGKIGGAVHLEDSEQFVEVDAVPELDITDGLTIQAWFFPEESQGDSNLMGRRSSANVGGYCLQWSAQFTGSPQIETWINIGGWQGSRNKQTIKPDLEEWHHVSSTFDGDMIRQYIDGKLDVEFAPPKGKINSIEVVFRIGKAQTGLPGMVGRVDEVAIYNRALTVDEINQDMENGVYFAVSPKDKLATTWGKLKM
ncbi:LamG domain-containing protein [Candidatus Poribacteria bacterium]|nr:LamG domain-containing protein [Candidatus Poribacteria bacterium]MYA56297.1 LamG domain-containing protein [Candidatus Poribacteria bacterium]